MVSITLANLKKEVLKDRNVRSKQVRTVQQVSPGIAVSILRGQDESRADDAVEEMSAAAVG